MGENDISNPVDLIILLCSENALCMLFSYHALVFITTHNSVPSWTTFDFGGESILQNNVRQRIIL